MTITQHIVTQYGDINLSKLTQVMACCPREPIHYVNQCCLSSFRSSNHEKLHIPREHTVVLLIIYLNEHCIKSRTGTKRNFHRISVMIGPYGHLFINRTDALPQDLVTSRNSKIRVLPFPIALKIDRHFGRDTCQISERYDHYNIQSRGFETSRELHETSYHWVNRGPVMKLLPDLLLVSSDTDFTLYVHPTKECLYLYVKCPKFG